jgi:hypothetical protein
MDFATTRRAWHGVAELVLAGPQYRRSGTIRLAAAPGGFVTTQDPSIAVVGGDLVAGDVRIGIDGRGCAELAAAAGVEAGAPVDVYHDGSGVDPGEVLSLDTAVALALAEAFSIGDAALRRLFPGPPPVLWPEHFDLGLTVDEVNYGVSPGDGFIDEPYAYVGPWRPREGPFWNAPFGAARPLTDLTDTDAVFAFYNEGRQLI